MSAIKPPPPLDATEPERITARANCAARHRARGRERLAASYEFGAEDAGWAMRHEVLRMRAEQGAS